MSTDVWVAGQLESWPSKMELASILGQAGLQLTVGRYSIRMNDFEHFVFQEYGGDLGDPVVDADADTLAELFSQTKQVSLALSRADVCHRFELYDDRDELVGYLHHRWPQLPGFDGTPFQTNVQFCLMCEEVRPGDEFEFLCVVPELGNLPRYLHVGCGATLTFLNPDGIPPAKDQI